MEKNVVELPLTEPLFSTYHYQGIGGAVLYNNPSLRNWYLNNAIQLSCNRTFIGTFTTPEISIKNSSFLDNPHIEVTSIPMRCLGIYVHGVIRTLLNDGCFVYYTGIDDFYVEGKSWYQEKHIHHDGLICGYNENKETYSLYAYDKNWIYRRFETPQNGFEEGRRTQFEQGIYGGISVIHAKEEHVSLDIKTIYRELCEYLDSNWEKYPPHTNETVYGIVVHDYIAMYLYKLIIGAFPYERMDHRVFRALWEHKKVMLERIAVVEKEIGLSDEISNQYKSIVKESENMRMIFASHHKRRRDSVLPLLIKKVIKLKKDEESVLQLLVSALKETF